MLTPQQKAARRFGIGSSDVAALVGCGPRSDLDVFNEKVFAYESRTEPWQKYGSLVEAGIIAYRVDELGARLWTPEDFAMAFGKRLVVPGIVRAEEHEIALATPDAIVTVNGAERPIRGLEAKNVAFDQSAAWGELDDDVPHNYFLQCQWQMGVTGIHQWELVASIGGRPPAVWTIKYRPEVYENLLVVAQRFWFDHVATGEHPPADMRSKAFATLLRCAFPEEQAPMQKATPELETAALDYVRWSAMFDECEEQKQEARNRACGLLGEAIGAGLSDGRKVTWKRDKRGNRVFRVSEKRGA